MIRKWIANLARRKPKVKTLVDLGGGSAFRTRILVRRHPKKSFVSVDKHLTPFTPRNLKAIKKDALEYLRKKKPESIKILNADFAGGSKERHEMLAKSDGRPPEGLLYSPEFFKECNRVLVKNGRLYLTVNSIDLANILKVLSSSGFKTSHQSLKEIYAKGRQDSNSEQIAQEFLKHHLDQGALALGVRREVQIPEFDFLANSVRIEARKAGFEKAKN